MLARSGKGNLDITRETFKLRDTRCSDDLVLGSPNEQDWTLISEQEKHNSLDVAKQGSLVNMQNK